MRNISCELHLVPKLGAHKDCCPRQVSIDQKAHAELDFWQWVKRLLLSQFTHISQRNPDVVGGDVVFTLYVLECHAVMPPARLPTITVTGKRSDLDLRQQTCILDA